MTSRSLNLLSENAESFFQAYSQLNLIEDYDKLPFIKGVDVVKYKEIIEKALKAGNEFNAVKQNMSALFFMSVDSRLHNGKYNELSRKVDKCMINLQLHIALNNSTQRDFLLKFLKCENAEQLDKLIDSINLKENRNPFSKLINLNLFDNNLYDKQFYYTGVCGPIELSSILDLIVHMRTKFNVPLNCLQTSMPKALMNNMNNLPAPPPEAPPAPFPKIV